MSTIDKSGESLISKKMNEMENKDEENGETRSEAKPPWAEVHRIAVQ
ncbi:23537_t:CDS:1, partial [Racocetra persica]